MPVISLEKPALALLQGWILNKDKADVLLSLDRKRVLEPIRTTEETILGRKSELPGAKPPGPNFIHIADAKSISRSHASISFNSTTSKWTLKCLSKNGLTLNDEVLKPENGAVLLSDLSAIKIGPAYCYFTLPGTSGASGSSHKKQSSKTPMILATAAAAPVKAETSGCSASAGGRGKYAGT